MKTEQIPTDVMYRQSVDFVIYLPAAPQISAHNFILKLDCHKHRIKSWLDIQVYLCRKLYAPLAFIESDTGQQIFNSISTQKNKNAYRASLINRVRTILVLGTGQYSQVLDSIGIGGYFLLF